MLLEMMIFQVRGYAVSYPTRHGEDVVRSTMISTCAACGDNTQNGQLSVCYNCRDAARESLDDVVLWYDEMIFPVVRSQNRGSSPGTSSLGEVWPDDNPRLGAPVKDLPMNDAVAQIRSEIRTMLWSWASAYVAMIAPHSALHRDGDVHDYARYLRSGESTLLASEAAIDYVHEIQRLAHKAQRTAAPGRRGGIIIGVHLSDDCDGGNVWAAHLFGTAKCANCGRKETVQWWYENCPPAGDDLLTDDEVVEEIRLYGELVSVARVRKFRFLGQLPAAAEHKFGRVATMRGEVQRFVADKWPRDLAV